ncbi:hypothetical protein PVL29_020943 [Vitis rotundifolia]|uniref:Glycosyltransferase n=1 Tax=Vitis rotundifolia TaxID=103349 RepID=A0AA39DCS9_VITRO|nr:hypothetical protein PVL29_020943 [Vitis rotundifolia]
MKDTIVLYPSTGISHLIPMVELGQNLLAHYPSFSITILISTLPSDTASTATYIASIAATTPSITFYHLPIVSYSNPSSYPALRFEFMALNNNNLRQTLESMSQTSSIKAFIIDFFCNYSFEISVNLNIPTYYFRPSGANSLAVFLYLPTIDRNITKSLKDDLNMQLHVPGLPSIVASDMPLPFLDRTTKAYRYFIDTAEQMAKSSGIIVNTFELLESRALKAISEGLCIPHGPTPPLFCIGPSILSSNRAGGGGSSDEHECLSWLNLQPSQSVVFLSFGSMGQFSVEQLKEMATGLERSDLRFLWVVRNPPSDEKEKHISDAPQPRLDSFFPEGFLERTKNRGFVVKSWVPQVAVLSHGSVGGFVTQCGWNSVMESVCAGVPMVAWPLHAEQRITRLFLVEELKIALAVNQLENGFVSATELENRVTELMDPDKGKPLRDRVTAIRDGAKAAIGEGGSSRIALAKLVESFKLA